MESVRRARGRLHLYPKLLAKCGPSAAEYARCVALRENVMKGDCTAEFESFKKCISEVAKKIKTRV